MLKKKPKLPLSKTHPKLAKEAYGWDPTNFTAASHKRMLWNCPKRHKWEATIKGRAIQKSGCPFCKRKRVLPGFNDLATTHPLLAKEAFGWNPTQILSGHYKKLPWRCLKLHTWEATPASRVNMKTGCPVCIGRKVQIGVNDLATTHPDLVMQIIKGDPTKYSAGSKKKFEWKCDSGHKYQAMIKSRALRGTGCGYCANNRSIRYSVPLSISHPLIAKEAYGWDPSKIKAGTSKKLSWICPKKHIYTAAPGWRTRDKGASGCPICSGKQILIGFNDLGTLKPEISKDAFGWNPEDFGIGSHKKVKWKCKQGHIYESQIKSRALNNSGCAVCVNQKLLTGYNDLKTKFPILAREAYGWDPSKILAGSRTKKKWQCQYGHIWTAQLNNRTSSAQSGCPSCAKFGFNPNESGFLYFIENTDQNMYQIGITNFPKDRLLVHSKSSWELIEIRGPMDGHLTQQWETAILRMLKAKGADLSNEKIAGKFDGYSEAWSKSTFPVKSIKELMRLTEEFEESKK